MVLLYIHPRLHCLHQQETSKNLLSIHFSAWSNGEISENKPKNTLQVIWPRKWLYRELFTAFFQHWVNLISLSKSPFFGLLKRSNTCLICAGGPLGDLYAIYGKWINFWPLHQLSLVLEEVPRRRRRATWPGFL